MAHLLQFTFQRRPIGLIQGPFCSLFSGQPILESIRLALDGRVQKGATAGGQGRGLVRKLAGQFDQELRGAGFPKPEV